MFISYVFVLVYHFFPLPAGMGMSDFSEVGKRFFFFTKYLN